jgi:hypothetical protein
MKGAARWRWPLNLGYSITISVNCKICELQNLWIAKSVNCFLMNEWMARFNVIVNAIIHQIFRLYQWWLLTSVMIAYISELLVIKSLW